MQLFWTISDSTNASTWPGWLKAWNPAGCTRTSLKIGSWEQQSPWLHQLSSVTGYILFWYTCPVHVHTCNTAGQRCLTGRLLTVCHGVRVVTEHGGDWGIVVTAWWRHSGGTSPVSVTIAHIRVIVIFKICNKTDKWWCLPWCPLHS